MAQITDPTAQAPQWHVTLYDGTTAVGFLLSNSRGERDEKAFRSYPLRDDAIRIQQGETKYSDESRFDQIVQENWRGGRGKDTFEDDRSRYWDAEGVDTTNEGSIVLGPKVTFGRAFRKENTLQASVYQWHSLLGSEVYLAKQFTAASGGYTAKEVRMWFRWFGLPSEFRVEIWSSDGTNPLAQLAVATFTPTESGGTLGSDIYSATLSITETLTGGTNYWIVARQSAGSPTAAKHVDVMVTDTSGNSKVSANGSTWASKVDVSPHYRITDDRSNYVARFYEYKSQLYFVKDYDDDTKNTELWMNGWRGAADSNSGVMNRLVDATKNWSSNFDGKIVRMIAGNASAFEDPDWREILAGANGYMTVRGNDWGKVHTVYDDYVVLGSNYWSSIPAPAGFTAGASVKDVIVDNEVVYFLRGEEYEIYKHREFNKNGVWTANSSEGFEHSWLRIVKSYADMGEIISDPVLGQQMWLVFEPGAQHSLRQQIRRFPVPESWEENPPAGIEIHDGKEDWDEYSAGARVIRAFDQGLQQTAVGVYAGVPQSAVADNNGENYQVGDILTILQWTTVPDNYLPNAGKNATVRVAAVDGNGAVTSVDTLTGGFDYTAGSKNTSGGSGDGNATVTLTTDSFTTGRVMTDSIAEVDMRDITTIRIRARSDITLPGGTYEFLIDNTAECASPVVAADLQSMPAKKWVVHEIDINPDNFPGLDKIISVGFQLAAATQTHNLIVRWDVLGYTDFDPVDLGVAGENISNLVPYGDPENLWLLSDRKIYEMRNGNPVPIQLKELAAVRSQINGRAVAVNDVYLYFNIRDGFHRYYRQNLENVGPNNDAGLGSKRGPIVNAVSYPGRVYAAIDGDNANNKRKSSILLFEGNSWHQVYTSGRYEDRIRNMFIQNVEDRADRLWFSMGSDVAWVPVSMNSTDTTTFDDDYVFGPEGWLETGWINTTRAVLQKVFKSITIFSENLSAGSREIDVWFQKDGDTTWTEVGTATSGPSHELRLVSGGFANAKRIRFKFRLRTDDGNQSPRLKAWVLKFYAIEPPTYGYQWTTLLTEGDLSINLEGDESKVWGTYDRAEDAMAKLREWSDNTTPLIMNAVFSPHDAKDVRLKAVPTQAFKVIPDDQIESHIVSITVEEL